ncbi:FixH family protein [Mucilaginibacter sp. UYNi724]
MNWGKGIIGGMVLFMLFILSMCVYMFMAPEDGYDHQYYEKGLNFDKDFKKEQQVQTDNARPVITVSEKTIRIVFSKPAAGTIKFVRPANEALDKTIQLDSTAGKDIAVPAASMAIGRWQVVLNWKSNHKAYLYQQNIDLK